MSGPLYSVPIRANICSTACAALSSVLPYKCPYTLSVIFGFACPSRRLIVKISTPAAIRLAPSNSRLEILAPSLRVDKLSSWLFTVDGAVPRLCDRQFFAHDPPDHPATSVNIVIVVGPMAATTAFVGADEGQHLLLFSCWGKISEDDGGGAP